MPAVIVNQMKTKSLTTPAKILNLISSIYSYIKFSTDNFRDVYKLLRAGKMIETWAVPGSTFKGCGGTESQLLLRCDIALT
jgi:hypothetical protein